MCDVHNHETSSTLFNSLPNQRKLDQNLKVEISELLKLGANKKLVKEKVENMTGKIVTLKDLTNIATLGKGQDTNDLEKIIKTLEDKYKCSVMVSVDSEYELKGIFIQDLEMKKTFESFPELLFLDGTYKLLDLRMSVSVLLIEDGNGQSEIVAVGLLVSEDKITLKWFLDCFKTLNPSCSRTRTVMTDKDLVERDVISEILPNVNLLLCVFHTLRTFKREITCDKMGITVGERDMCRKILQDLCYSFSEKEYNNHFAYLQKVAPKPVLQYFISNWHNIRKQWVRGFMACSGNFLNFTNNRLESTNKTLKTVIKAYSSLSSFVENLFICIKTMRSERDSKAAKMCQKVLTCSFPPFSVQEQYSKHLTPHAFNLLNKELIKSQYIKNTSEFNASLISSVTENSCNCLFFNSMHGLPCRHIFVFRREYSMDLFDKDLFDQRWSQENYTDVHRAFKKCTTNVTFSADSHSINPDIFIFPKKKILSTNEKFKAARQIAEKLANIAAESSNVHFDRKMDTLNKILKIWSAGKDVVLLESNDFNPGYDISAQHSPFEDLETCPVDNAENMPFADELLIVDDEDSRAVSSENVTYA